VTVESGASACKAIRPHTSPQCTQAPSLIRDKLDRVHAKHPDMMLLHGGSPKGAERIAAKWADHRKVPQIAFKRALEQ